MRKTRERLVSRPRIAHDFLHLDLAKQKGKERQLSITKAAAAADLSQCFALSFFSANSPRVLSASVQCFFAFSSCLSFCVFFLLFRYFLLLNRISLEHLPESARKRSPIPSTLDTKESLMHASSSQDRKEDEDFKKPIEKQKKKKISPAHEGGLNQSSSSSSSFSASGSPHYPPSPISSPGVYTPETNSQPIPPFLFPSSLLFSFCFLFSWCSTSREFSPGLLTVCLRLFPPSGG